MIRILVVDDELVVRVGIKSMIDWNSHGFEVVGEAADGKEALSKISQLDPHIVITDIKMSGMDGIELIKKIQESYSHIKVLVLSCHNDFEYVKQAMKLGAVDYILKLSMRREELTEVMEKIKNQINEIEEKSIYENSLQRKIKNNMDTIKEKFFKKVLSSNKLSMEELFSEAEDLGIRFLRGHYVVLVIQINKYINEQKKTKLEPELLRDAVLNIIVEAIPKQLVSEAFAESDERFVMIFTFDDTIDRFSMITKEIDSFTRYLLDLLLTYLNLHVSIGIEDAMITNAEQFHKGYKKALKAVEHSFYFNESMIINSSDINYNKQVHEYFDNNMQKRIYTSLDTGDVDGACDFIREILKVVDSEKQLSPGDVKRIGKMIIATLNQVVRARNMMDDEGKPLEFDLREMEIQQIDNINMLQRLIDECMIEYSGIYNNGLKGIYTKEIRKLLLYINENFHKDMTLEQAAGLLNVGKNYFCSVFKKETGQTFNNYLINVRMEKAKELLRTTPLKNYEIALKVGYDNFNYFSTVFKRVTGVYPNEFRKN